MSRSDGQYGVQLRGRYWPTPKAYRALGLPVPRVSEPMTWKRVGVIVAMAAPVGFVLGIAAAEIIIRVTR